MTFGMLMFVNDAVSVSIQILHLQRRCPPSTLDPCLFRIYYSSPSCRILRFLGRPGFFLFVPLPFPLLDLCLCRDDPLSREVVPSLTAHVVFGFSLLGFETQEVLFGAEY